MELEDELTLVKHFKICTDFFHKMLSKIFFEDMCRYIYSHITCVYEHTLNKIHMELHSER